jgi:hypothetical protein
MTREITAAEATEMTDLARNLVKAHEQRSPTSGNATLGENDALFNLHWRLARLFRQVAGRDGDG